MIDLANWTRVNFTREMDQTGNVVLIAVSGYEPGVEEIQRGIALAIKPEDEIRLIRALTVDKEVKRDASR